MTLLIQIIHVYKITVFYDITWSMSWRREQVTDVAPGLSLVQLFINDGCFRGHTLIMIMIFRRHLITSDFTLPSQIEKISVISFMTVDRILCVCIVRFVAL